MTNRRVSVERLERRQGLRLDVLLGALVSGLLLVAACPAMASHIEPSQAKKAQFTLVNGFDQCFTSNTATQSGNMPACAPAVPSSGLTGCALLATGSGKLTFALAGSATSGNQDVKISASVKGLNALCENRQ